MLSCLLCAVTEFNRKHTWIWVILQNYVNTCAPSKWIPEVFVLGVIQVWHLSYAEFWTGLFKNFIESIMYLNYAAQCTYLICFHWRCVIFNWISFGGYSDEKVLFKMQNFYLNKLAFHNNYWIYFQIIIQWKTNDLLDLLSYQ